MASMRWQTFGLWVGLVPAFLMGGATAPVMTASDDSPTALPAVPEPSPKPLSSPATTATAEPEAPGPNHGDTSLLTIPSNREWDVLAPPGGPQDYRRRLEQAGERLGNWPIYLGGIRFRGPRLEKIARSLPDEPFLRVVREALRRPIDLLDFIFFLDDVLLAGEQAGARGRLLWITSGRARKAGIFLHPDDVFKKDKPRLYGVHYNRLNVDKPRPQRYLSPAEDGDLLGPNWTRRYLNPGTRQTKLKALAQKNPSGGFADRVRSLLNQLEAQDADAGLWTTVRSRKRGYLMWGSFMLSRTKSEKELDAGVEKLRRLNEEWGLGIPIQWQHPDGWLATVEAARQMKDTYDVVYATQSGARSSNHYDGVAVDITAQALPRQLLLRAPDGKRKRFDLSDPNESRDLSLTPALIRWIEKHFQMKKLLSDYPHWDDAAPSAKQG